MLFYPVAGVDVGRHQGVGVRRELQRAGRLISRRPFWEQVVLVGVASAMIANTRQPALQGKLSCLAEALACGSLCDACPSCPLGGELSWYCGDATTSFGYLG